MPDRTHRTHQRIGFQVVLIVATSKLATTIRTQKYQMVALTLPDSHLCRSNHHLPVWAVMHRPAHDTLVEQVQDDTQMQLALLRLNLTDVCDPLGFRFQRSEVSLQPVTPAPGAPEQPGYAGREAWAPCEPSPAIN